VLIRRHDAALDDQEWRSFLGAHDFGELIAAGRDRPVPVVVPAHFVFDGERTIHLHLAKENPVWEAIAERAVAMMSTFDAYTYIPTGWNAPVATPPEAGVPTSYYAAVQAICDVSVVDDPDAVAGILRKQLGHFQPEGGHAPVTGSPPYGPLLSAIRGIEMRIVDVRAKFKFGGNRTSEHRQRIAERLAERAGPLDLEARDHLLRRLERG